MVTDVRLIVELAWETGREYERARLVELAEELSLLNLMPPPVTAEERVQERLRLFERCAAEGHARRGTKPWVGVSP